MDRILSLVPKFSGLENPIEWLYKLEACLELVELEPIEVLPYIILLLEGEGYLWYSVVLDFPMFSNLDEFRSKFLDYFLPCNQTTLDSLSKVKFTAKLGFKRFVTELNLRFSRLNYLADDLFKIQWFIRNLSLEWQAHFLSLKLKRYEELCYYAINLDGIENLVELNLELQPTQEPNLSVEANGNLEKMKNRTSIYWDEKLSLNRSLATKKGTATLKGVEPCLVKAPQLDVQLKPVHPNGQVSKLPSFKKQMYNQMDPPNATVAVAPPTPLPLTETLACEVLVQDVPLTGMLLPTNQHNTLSLSKLNSLIALGCLLDFSTNFNPDWPKLYFNLNPHPLEVVGEVGFEVKFLNSNLTFTIDPIYVVKQQKIDLVLGNLFLQQHKFWLDFKLSRVRVFTKDRKVPNLLKASLIQLEN